MRTEDLVGTSVTSDSLENPCGGQPAYPFFTGDY
jgi:hypothetical protein